MSGLVLALRFALELGLLAALAPRRLGDPRRALLELVLFSLGVAGLVASGRPVVAAAFGGLVVAHLAAMVALGLRGR